MGNTMIRFKNFIAEAKFSPKNFPASVGNNKDFSGAGERTMYAPEVANDYIFKEGFPMDKDAVVYAEGGKEVKTLSKGDIIHFTMPAKLFRNKELGIKKTGTFAAISLKGFDQQPIGYVPISSVTKPGGNSQGRVGAGSKTQDMVALQVKDIAFSKGIKVETEFKTAKPGSTIPDLVMTINGETTQFEIKGTNSRTAPITFFDKSVKRTGKVPEIIDEIAQDYISTLKIDGKLVSTAMRKARHKNNFIGAIDYFQSIDSAIGLAGDKGVSKSGRLPPQFATTDKKLLTKLRQTILDHFKEGGDDYFVVHNRSGKGSFEIYYVGGGNAGNVIKMPELPQFKSFVLATYGGASSGSTRVGLKIKL